MYKNRRKQFPKFLNKYAKSNMQNLKITKNTNNSPTLKINIVLNVQNIKEIKGLEDFPE